MEEVNWNQNSHMTPAFSIILGKLGKGYKRFNNLKHSKRLLYRLCLDSLPTKNIKKGKIKPSLERTCITGGHRNAVEVCFQEGNWLQGPVCQASAPSIKEGSRKTISGQPEVFKHINTLQTFQDGKTPSIKGNFGTRRLSMQAVPQRRLFLYSIEQTVKEICAFRMRAFPRRITFSVFWTLSSPKVV